MSLEACFRYLQHARLRTFNRVMSSSCSCSSMTEMVSATAITSADSSLTLSFIPAIFSSSSLLTAANLLDSSSLRIWRSCSKWLLINSCVSSAWLWGKMSQSLSYFICRSMKTWSLNGLPWYIGLCLQWFPAFFWGRPVSLVNSQGIERAPPYNREGINAVNS